jgi:hypothetical protein
LEIDRAYVARALKQLGAPANEIAGSMHKSQYTPDDIALALRLNEFSAEDTSRAMLSAKIAKEKIPAALSYAGYKKAR